MIARGSRSHRGLTEARRHGGTEDTEGARVLTEARRVSRRARRSHGGTEDTEVSRRHGGTEDTEAQRTRRTHGGTEDTEGAQRTRRHGGTEAQRTRRTHGGTEDTEDTEGARVLTEARRIVALRHYDVAVKSKTIGGLTAL